MHTTTYLPAAEAAKLIPLRDRRASQPEPEPQPRPERLPTGYRERVSGRRLRGHVVA